MKQTDVLNGNTGYKSSYNGTHRNFSICCFRNGSSYIYDYCVTKSS